MTGAALVVPGDPTDPAVARLLRRAEALAYALYPPESVHMLPVAELRAPDVRFLVARDAAGNAPLGCGAVTVEAGGYGEIKRMYVEDAARRRGIGRCLLKSLEAAAGEAGVRVLRLETGPRQPEAIALYRACGFVPRGPFAGYPDDPNSVFMEKALRPSVPAAQEAPA